jgi:nicotinamidase-related amidase
MGATANVKPPGGAMPRPAFVVVDVQERLFAAMDPERRDLMIANLKILAAAARRLGHPVLLTEQYPKGLGRTLPELRGLLDGVEPVEKTAFSCGGVPGFIERLRALDAGPVVLAGVEAHVCVLLTALDLITAGFSVSIVADAVCSRRRENLDLGLAQARQAGAIVTSTETLVFQWLGRSDTDAFREMAKLFKE